jgi:hypothetical protein
LADQKNLLVHWQNAWTDALTLWSRYTQLRAPALCETQVAAANLGLTESFAMIRLSDQTVVVDLEAIASYQLHDYAVEVLAHEIGHHILSPATLTDHVRMIARMHVNLPTIEHQASMVANLYSDLLINNHLQRQCGLRMDEVYQKINQTPSESQLWLLYMRIYEHLWQLKPGALGGVCDSDAMEGDAWLGARIIRVYASEWLIGASRFAALLLPYLINQNEKSEHISKLMDTQNAGDGQLPPGLVGKDSGEKDAMHPSQDSALTGENANHELTEIDAVSQAPGEPGQHSTGQYREPFEYGEILKSAGLKLSDHDIAKRYYRERAIPWLVSFPAKQQPTKTELIPEGTAPWEPGEAIEDIDWFSTLATSPVVIPGVTTLQRVWGESFDNEMEISPCNLDLYVDCSGSMPNPQLQISYTTLAGAILCLSALRAGSAVQVTLWSGTQQFKTTDGFVRNENLIMEVLTDYFGGGTAFPIHILRKTHIEQYRERDSHVVILSDDGVTTMFNQDEQGNSGWNIAGQALDAAGGGGSLVLNLPWAFSSSGPSQHWQQTNDQLQRAQIEQGWDIYPVSSWEAMIDFAQSFSHRYYESSVA